ncbi:alpha/beta hydrolase [Lentzea sp.]|uniref:alpha/beta fold hydrolase n=1 Tax=Lentzea sp. TaxID=56099 RepID=UPI002ED5C31D
MPSSGPTPQTWTRGNENGAAVVFTHGTMDAHETFDPLVPFFVDAGYRTVTWDLPGHGASSSGGLDFSVPGAAADLLALLDGLGVERAVLVGHSLGGYVSQKAAIRAPGRVLALALIGATSLTLKPPVLPMAVMRLSAPLLRLVPKRLVRRRVPVHSTCSSGARDHLRQAGRHVSDGTLVHAWGAVVDAVRHIDPRRRLRVPTLVCRGEHDTTGIIATAAPDWARLHRLVRYHVIPGAGHLAHRDNPAGTARALPAFLRDPRAVVQTRRPAHTVVL